MTKITISVRKHFKLEEIENLIYSMAEGSKYWCENSFKLGFESTVKEILSGEYFEVLIDEENKEHQFNLQKIKRGLTVMAKKEPKHFADIISGDTDQTTADVLLQCSLFGEVIYG